MLHFQYKQVFKNFKKGKMFEKWDQNECRGTVPPLLGVYLMKIHGTILYSSV